MDPAWFETIANDPVPVLTALAVVYSIFRLSKHEKACGDAQKEVDRKLTQLCDGQQQLKDSMSEIKHRLEKGDDRFDMIERNLPRRYRR